MELTKEQQIHTVLQPLLAAIALHKAGRMDDKTLGVMNQTAFDKLQQIDPDRAEPLLRRLKGGAL